MTGITQAVANYEANEKKKAISNITILTSQVQHQHHKPNIENGKSNE
jgi:hypothetical protein